MFLSQWNLMTLIYNNATKKTHNAPGIQTRIPGLGHTNTVEYLDNTQWLAPYFNEFVQRMVQEEGYNPGFSIRAAPYDFRKAASKYS